MRKTIFTTYLLTIVGILGMSCLADGAEPSGVQRYGRPQRFEKAIEQFEAADKKQPPPQGAIVCVGSSSMRGWHATIKEDLAPLTVIGRGFGGSNMNDALHYVDRVVLRYKPRAVVVYEGDNDIAQGIAPEMVAETFSKFAEQIHKQLPECRVYFLSIKPSISRWDMWPKMKQANKLIAVQCASDKRLTFVDVASGMLGEDGNPRKDIFKKDNLHMTRGGYVIWRDALRPVLLNGEDKFE